MNSEEKKRWLVVLTGPARKSLKKVPARDLARVNAAIEGMQDNPFQGDIRKLQGGREGFRRRVGNWRVFFDLYPSEARVVVTAIERRTSTTY
jgi:mRNA-degrading endonuclease RelE of RelBE toxin-antitoxin system